MTRMFCHISLAIMMSLFVGCAATSSSDDNNSVDINQNGFSEAQLQGLKTAAQEHHVVAVQLEHPDANVDDGDSDGVAGQDTIPFFVPNDRSLTFCMEDDNGQAHTMTLKDSNGSQILKVTAGGDCVTKSVKAGNYTQNLQHDGSGTADDRNTLFIQPRYGPFDFDQLPALKVETTDHTNCTFTANVSFKSGGQYLAADGLAEQFAGSNTVDLDSTKIGTAETFPLWHCNDNRIVLQGHGDLNLSGQPPFLEYDPGSCLVGTDISSVLDDFAFLGPEDQFFYDYDGTTGLVSLMNSSKETLEIVSQASLNPEADEVFSTLGRACSGNTADDGEGDGISAFEPVSPLFILIITGSCESCNFEGINLSEYDLSDANLENAHFINATLSFAFMADTNLKGADMTGADLQHVDFYKIDGSPSLEGATLFRTSFANANLIDLNLDEAKIEGADFTNAQMLGATLKGITHTFGTSNGNASFVETLLAGATFDNSTFDGGNFTNAIFSTKDGTVNLTVRNTPTTSETNPYNFDATVRPLSTDDNTICPNTTDGPCSTDAQWVAVDPPSYEGFNNPNDW